MQLFPAMLLANTLTKLQTNPRDTCLAIPPGDYPLDKILKLTLTRTPDPNRPTRREMFLISTQVGVGHLSPPG